MPHAARHHMLNNSANTAAADTCGKAVALSGLTAGFVSFQRH